MTRLRLLALCLCWALPANAWADLRTYDVDPQYRQEVYTALHDVLAPAGNSSPTQGRVELLPSGQILVNAAPETLQQIEAVLQAIRARPVEATPRAELRYWAVLGNRGQNGNAPGASPPNVLDEVLAELKRTHGDLSFRVIGTATLLTESGQPGNISGATLEIAQTTFVQGDFLNAIIGINLEGTAEGGDRFPVGDLRVRTPLRRGDFVVLGQSEVDEGGFDGPVFFVVHWPEE
jgi:hypothetical protein